MSMLAEPRRKKAWVLNPRGSKWAEDDSKFGQKMLEQMGWSKGQGLGREKSGITEHIRPSVQNDSKGLGFEGNSDDWVAHSEDFNDLLAKLQQDQNEPNGGDCSAAKRPKSLEETSKKSRARVHYHKFTRGKDLSRASSRDLACILGGRPDPPGSQPATPVTSRPPSPPRRADSEPETDARAGPEPAAAQVDASSGYTTISTGKSVKDYFAEKMQKMQMLKLKRQQCADPPVSSQSDADDPAHSIAGPNNHSEAATDEKRTATKSKKKKKKRCATGDETSRCSPTEAKDIAAETAVENKKRKHAAECPLPAGDQPAEAALRRRKKKQNIDQGELSHENVAEIDCVSRKKSRSCVEMPKEMVETPEVEGAVAKKGSSGYPEQCQGDNPGACGVAVDSFHSQGTGKKRKKSKKGLE